MATNFPTAFDTNAIGELGGAFVNVSPPLMPANSISAVHRNNLNDAMFAVQAKLGILGSLVPTSVDWGLLGTGGTPNQGLRFSIDNAAWPGAPGDNGIFLRTATGVPAFHFAGGADYDVVTDAIYGLQSAYDHVATIVTAGGTDLAVSGSENVSFTFGGATKQLLVSNPAFQSDGSGFVDKSCATYLTMTPTDDGLYTATVHLNSNGFLSCTALRAVAESAVVMTNTQAQTACRAGNIVLSGPVGPGEVAYLYDFWADSPAVGAGGSTSYGFYANSTHDYSFYSSAAVVHGFHSESDLYGFYSQSAGSAGFFSNSDAYGLRVTAATNAAFFCFAGSGTNIELHAATNYDIFSAQTKVEFDFAHAANDCFLLSAAGLDATGGRTSTAGMLALNCPVQTGAIAQNITLTNSLAGDKLGGIGVHMEIVTRTTSGAGSLAGGGEITGYEAIHKMDVLDNHLAASTSFKSVFSFENGAGTNDGGPDAYGLYVDMPEVYDAFNIYHNNDGTYALSRWAICVTAGESKLRRTFIEGPVDLGKATLHVSQQDANLEIVTLQGTSAAVPSVGGNLTTTTAGAIVGPGATNWAFAGMFKVSIVDDNAGIMDGTYWIPLYSVVP